MDITHDHHMTPSHHNYLPVNYIPNLEPQITKYTVLQPPLINMGASGTAMAERQVSKSTAVAMAHCNPSVNSVSASYSLNVMVNNTPTSNTGVVSPLIQYPGLDHQLAGLQKAAFEYGSGFNLKDGFGFEDNPQIVEDHHQLDYGYEGGAGMVQARVDRLHEEVKSEAGRKSGVLLGGLGNGGVDKDSRVAANPSRISKTLKQEPSIVTHYGGSAPGTDEATSEMRTHNPALAPPSSSFLHSLVDIESVKDSELGILGQRVDMDTFDTVASTISSANGDYNGFDISFFSSLFSSASDMANSCINGTREEQLYGIINPKSSNNNNNRSSNMTSGSSATHAPPTSLTRCKTQSSTTKRRKSQQKRVVYVPATGGPDRPTGECIPSDTWAWRKYGQKPIKGSPHPRSYYKCSSVKGCTARKQVERNPADPLIIVVTYTADHSHPASSSSVAEQQHPVLATKSDENELDEDEDERRTQAGSDEIKQDITNNTLQAIDDTTMNDDMVSEGSCDRLSSEGHDENMTMPDTNVQSSTDRKLHHHGADKSSNVGVAKAQKVSDIFQCEKAVLYP